MSYTFPLPLVSTCFHKKKKKNQVKRKLQKERESLLYCTLCSPHNVFRDSFISFNSFLLVLTLEAPTHKMVKITQTICRLLPINYLTVFDHFVGLALEGLVSFFFFRKSFFIKNCILLYTHFSCRFNTFYIK